MIAFEQPIQEARPPESGDVPDTSHKPLFIELFAGHATLSSCFREVGLEVLPVDSPRSRFHPVVPVCKLDLTKQHAWAFLEGLLDQYDVIFVHAAPPHGTCSSSCGAQFPESCAPTLRSASYPMGKPDLNKQDLARVGAANAIYLGLSAYLKSCNARCIPWSVINPANSFLWELPCIVELYDTAKFTDFDGANRAAKRALLSPLPQMSQLQDFCAGLRQGDQLEFKPKASGSSVTLPSDGHACSMELAMQIMQIVCQSLPIACQSVCKPSPTPLPLNLRGSIALGKQPRGRQLPPLVSEFKHLATFALASLPALDDKQKLLEPFRGLPAGSKLITPLKKRGTAERGDQNQDEKPCLQYTFGVYRSPLEFVREASLLVHPFDLFHALPDIMLVVIFRNLTEGLANVASRRANILKEWTGWAKELAGKERKLHSNLEKGVAAVLVGKRILLMKRIAQALEWPDIAVFDEMVQGFKIVGSQPPSGIFALEPRPACMSVEELESSAKFLRPALLGKVRSSAVDEDLVRLLEVTQDETQHKNWMVGPMSVDHVHDLHGPTWIPVRRFGVWQSSGEVRKLRPIDDYAENRVNASFSYLDKLDLRAMDQIVWSAVAITKMANARGEACVRLSSGEVLRGPVHSSLLQDDAWKPLISVLDLASAYKQLALHPSCRIFSIVTLKDPATSKLLCFEGRVLPFGAVASVVHFNRLSRFLQAVGFHLDLLWGNYFDDYPVVTPAALSQSSMKCMVNLLDLLGFAYSGHKLKDFASEASVLGVDVDLTRVGELEVLVKNKRSRVEDILNSVQQVMESKSLTFSECSKILGRVQFADSQIMGRAGKLAMCTIRESVRKHETSSQVGDEVLESFHVLVQRLTSGVPRTIPCAEETSPVLVFTDGASEGCIHTVGGVLIDQCSGPPQIFSGVVPASLTEAWGAELKHIIGPVELYAVILARSVWHKILCRRRCIYFVDNNSSMDCLIRGTSASRIFRELLLCFEKLELSGPSWPWFSRVASESNISDKPSRGRFDPVLDQLGAIKVKPVCPITGTRLCEIS